jgi:two-component system KDP operon response regulator KdpE
MSISPSAPLILIVEDELPIRRFMRPALEDQGWRVIEADSVQGGVAMAASHAPEIVLLDLGLPDGDGKQLIGALRAWTATPIIVVTARDRDDEKIAALDAGADDYLVKPFSVPELLARVRVALRHAARGRAGQAESPVFRVGALEIDLAARRVRLAGELLALTRIEFKLLAELARHPGRVLTHRALLTAVWGPGRAEEPQLVRVHLANLRKKLEADTTRPRYLLTEPGVGYRLADE